MRAGPRSQQTALSLAVVAVLNRHLAASPLRSVHRLAQVVPTVSRSQLYLLMNGDAVIDVAEMFAICDALEVSPHAVLAEAERDVAEAPVAAYDEPHAIEREHATPEEP